MIQKNETGCAIPSRTAAGLHVSRYFQYIATAAAKTTSNMDGIGLLAICRPGIILDGFDSALLLLYGKMPP